MVTKGQAAILRECEIWLNNVKTLAQKGRFDEARNYYYMIYGAKIVICNLGFEDLVWRIKDIESVAYAYAFALK